MRQPDTLSSIGEREWLRRLRRWFAQQDKRFCIAMGDDAAALNLTGLSGPLLVTTDSMIESVHFRLQWISPRDLGAKALAVSLSDLAAMGAQPLAAFVALSIPARTPVSRLKAFFMGLREEGRTDGCPLLGGDLTQAPQWVINVTVLGLPAVQGRLARRGSARAGQYLYVSGWPGESGAGLTALEHQLHPASLLKRHRRPTPRLKEAALLMRRCPDLAMIDVSDGIWNDADQLAEASAIRIELEVAALPTTPAMNRLALKLGTDPCHWTLFGGEDYELLFTTATSLESIERDFAKADLKTPVHCIGRVRPGRNVHLMDPNGRELAVTDRTFRHF